MQDSYGVEITYPSPFRTVDDVIVANKRAGQHFFDSATMRFFRSRVGGALYAGRFFITSERNDMGDYPRLYTVRVAHDDGTIGEMGEFQQYASWSGATKACERYARQLVGHVTVSFVD